MQTNKNAQDTACGYDGTKLEFSNKSFKSKIKTWVFNRMKLAMTIAVFKRTVFKLEIKIAATDF